MLYNIFVSEIVSNDDTIFKADINVLHYRNSLTGWKQHGYVKDVCTLQVLKVTY